MWTKIFKASNHGLVRGVAIYSVTWPVRSIIQQSLDPSGNKEIDLQRAGKFSMYGGLYVAPTLYTWMRFASHVWPSTTITSHITKVRTVSIVKKTIKNITQILFQTFYWILVLYLSIDSN